MKTLKHVLKELSPFHHSANFKKMSPNGIDLLSRNNTIAQVIKEEKTAVCFIILEKRALTIREVCISNFSFPHLLSLQSMCSAVCKADGKGTPEGR